MRWKGLVSGAAMLLVAALAFAGVVLLGDGQTEAPGERSSTRQEPASVTGSREQSPTETLVIRRRRGGVPRAWARRLSAVPGVTAVARTARTQALVRRTQNARGRTVDAPPRGYALALDALVIRPRSYAAVLPSSARATLRRLRPGSVLLSRTSARLRRVGVGGRIALADGRTLRVAGVLDDDLVRGAELAIRPSDAASGSRSPQLVVATTQPRRLLRALPRSRTLRVRPFAAAGRPARGGIARPVELKARFGEFAVRLPYGENWIGIEPGWLRRNIVTRSVPILGRVACNRRLFPPLRRALGELERRGLSRLVDRGDYAGCYAPRRIPGSGSLSLHAWGLAIDLNASRNPQYGASRNDPRLVRAMERAGFTWGGRWPTAPDPMHFELQAPAER